jgi:hypothetical protein
MGMVNSNLDRSLPDEQAQIMTLNRDQWPMWAEMIRSEQMTPDQVQQLLEDHPKFAAWYDALEVADRAAQDKVEGHK